MKHPLRAYLDRTGETQGQLAHRIGVSEAFLSRILSGERGMRPDTALRVAQITGIPVTDLLYPGKKIELSAAGGCR